VQKPKVSTTDPNKKRGEKKGDHTSGRHNPATSTGTPPSPWSRTHNDILTASTTILGHDLLENPRKVQGEGERVLLCEADTQFLIDVAKRRCIFSRGENKKRKR
jgi:hypothetical protein